MHSSIGRITPHYYSPMQACVQNPPNFPAPGLPCTASNTIEWLYESMLWSAPVASALVFTHIQHFSLDMKEVHLGRSIIPEWTDNLAAVPSTRKHCGFYCCLASMCMRWTTAIYFMWCIEKQNLATRDFSLGCSPVTWSYAFPTVHLSQSNVWTICIISRFARNIHAHPIFTNMTDLSIPQDNTSNQRTPWFIEKKSTDYYREFLDPQMPSGYEGLYKTR